MEGKGERGEKKRGDHTRCFGVGGSLRLAVALDLNARSLKPKDYTE